MRVERLGASDADGVTEVLTESFRDYPVMRHVISAHPDYDARLQALVRFFVAVREHRDEILLGIRDGRALVAAALVSYPHRGPSPAAVEPIRDATWARLGADARARYERFGAATAPLIADDPHLHLNMIGVRRAAQGTGLGGRLLDAVHALSAADETSSGVSLTTEHEPNVALYRRHGYELVGTATVDDAFTTWSMFRSDG